MIHALSVCDITDIKCWDPLLVNDIRHIKHYIQEKVSHNTVL